MPYLQMNRVRLWYELHGRQGAEVVAFLNGILMTTSSWALQTPVIARHYRVLLYDMRNQGASDHPPDTCSMASHA